MVILEPIEHFENWQCFCGIQVPKIFKKQHKNINRNVESKWLPNILVRINAKRETAILNQLLNHIYHHHHHHVTLSARKFLTLSRHHPYRPLLLAGLQVDIPYWHRAAVCRYEPAVPPLHVHVKGSTGVIRLWAHPDSSSSVPHVWFV